MESPGKSDSDPDEQMKEDSRKSPSEESAQLEETEQKEDHKEGEAAQSDPDAPEGSNPSEDSDKSTESEESEKERKKNKPGEKKVPDEYDILGRGRGQPNKEDSDSLSSDSKKSSSEESVQDTEQKDLREREAADSGPDTPTGLSNDSDKSTELEESEKKRENATPGEVTKDEKKADGTILRQALMRPKKDSDLSTGSMQLEDTEQIEGEAAERCSPEGSSKDSEKSTESEESNKERRIVNPGEEMEDEKRAPDGSMLRQALMRPNQDLDNLSTEVRVGDSRAPSEVPSPSEVGADSSTTPPEASSPIPIGPTEVVDSPLLRRALSRPRSDVDKASIEARVGDSRAPSEVPSPSEGGGDSSNTPPEASSPIPIGPTEVVDSPLLRDALSRPEDDVDKVSSEARVGDSRAPSEVPSPSEVGGDSSTTPPEAPSPIPIGPTEVVDSPLLRDALSRPEDDVDKVSSEARVGDSRAPSEVPSPSEVGGDSSTTPPEAPSPIPIGPTGVVDSPLLRRALSRPEGDVEKASIGPTGVVDSPLLRDALSRPQDDVDQASIEVRVGDSRNPSEAPSPIEEIEEAGPPGEVSGQDVTSAESSGTSPPSEAGQVEPLPASSSAQAADTDPNEDSAVTTNETSIESISSTSPTSGDEIRNEEIVVEAQYILAPRRTPPSTDDTTSSEGIPDNVGNGVRYVYTSSEGEVNNEENPDVPLPRPSPEVPEDIPVEDEARASSASSAISTSSNSPNSTRSSGSSSISTSSSSSNEGGSTGNASGGSSPNEPTSTNRRSTDTRPDIPDTSSNEALPRIIEATTEEEEAAARADSTPTTPRRIFGESQVHETNAPGGNDEPLTVTITTSPSSIPPASSLTRSPVSHGTSTQISPALRSSVRSPRVTPMPDLITRVIEPTTSTSTSCSLENPIIPPNTSVSVPSSSTSGTAPVTAASSVSIPANQSLSATSGSSASMPSASSVTSPSISETRTSNPPVAGSKRKITSPVEPPPVTSQPSSSPVQGPPEPLSAAGAPPAPPVTPPPQAPPSLPSSHAPGPAVQSPLRSPVPKKRQRQQYHEGVPPSAAVTLSGIPCIDPNELRPEEPTPRQGTKRRTSGADDAAVAGPSGSGHGGWRSKRSREDEEDDIPELHINPRPPLEPPVHKISDDDSGAESGDDLLRVTPPNEGAARDDHGIDGIEPLPRRPPNQENGDPKKARILKNQETDIEIMVENVDWLDGFGLKFVGGSDTWIVGPAVVVYDIEMTSPAFDDRRIMVGDQIRAVCGVKITEDMTYTQIFELLSMIGTSMHLTIFRPDPIPYDKIIVTLKAKEGAVFGDNFGLRLSSTFLLSNFGSMYIDGFDKSSVADIDGRLKRGDFVKRINGHNMLKASHPNAAFALYAHTSKEGATIVCKRFKISNV